MTNERVSEFEDRNDLNRMYPFWTTERKKDFKNRASRSYEIISKGLTFVTLEF